MSGQERFLCNLDDIADGRSKGAVPDKRGRDRVLLVRQGERVYGYVNTCPHYDRAPMAWKKDEFLNGDHSKIVCASHGALFRIEDGVCELGPCLGQALEPVHLTVRDGAVFTVGLSIDQAA
ncbi:Rieske (2Fe-2S) protein [Planktotalea sp.]|uniref:Rieske (2Fe-2S) protein n=1 Tax=Planktotalea sp. TaxID=2029877 RepID=UPI003F6D5D44